MSEHTAAATSDADKPGVNSDIRHRNAALLSIAHELPPRVVTSSYFDEQLSNTYKRLKMPKGLLERLAGISDVVAGLRAKLLKMVPLLQQRKRFELRRLTGTKWGCSLMLL